MAQVISLSEVTVLRGNNPILNNFSWQVSEGQRWVVMGPNGAGKTTLMQVCSGYLHPTSGSATILDAQLGSTDVRELRTQIGISSAAVSALMPPKETVLDTVLTAAHGVVGRWREQYEDLDIARAHAMLRAWGLENLASRLIGTLSEGERKRVQIARALMADPELLLLDEPAAGLDVAGREDLIARLSRLAADPTAPVIILVTHHVEEIPPNFTDALLIANGKISAIGPVQEVIATSPMSRAFGAPLTVEFVDDRWYARGRTPSKGRRARSN
ncbi:MAG: ABC transporter ATP-binding protein [Actinobacteria bacterium]|nr:ABC transporter ATP-binding protein [Actinomycetota bacterium]NBY15135.1 ABC transporter ATP-binding protein [Actinomycetota bacterium]